MGAKKRLPSAPRHAARVCQSMSSSQFGLATVTATLDRRGVARAALITLPHSSYDARPWLDVPAFCSSSFDGVTLRLFAGSPVGPSVQFQPRNRLNFFPERATTNPPDQTLAYLRGDTL